MRNLSQASGIPIEVLRANPSDVECEKARERRLRRQATQGVVALFNAVRQHQSAVEKQLDGTGPLVFQKEKVLTDLSASDFLDRLSAGLPGAKAKTSATTKPVLVDEVPQAKPAAPKRKLNDFPVSISKYIDTTI